MSNHTTSNSPDKSGAQTARTVAVQLGFDPNIGFITFTRGRVGFTCGKPEEIRSLRAACVRAGMKMTTGLMEGAK